jgi:hypothetical protein
MQITRRRRSFAHRGILKSMLLKRILESQKMTPIYPSKRIILHTHVRRPIARPASQAQGHRSPGPIFVGICISET